MPVAPPQSAQPPEPLVSSDWLPPDWLAEPRLQGRDETTTSSTAASPDAPAAESHEPPISPELSDLFHRFLRGLRGPGEESKPTPAPGDEAKKQVAEDSDGRNHPISIEPAVSAVELNAVAEIDTGSSQLRDISTEPASTVSHHCGADGDRGQLPPSCRLKNRNHRTDPTSGSRRPSLPSAPMTVSRTRLTTRHQRRIQVQLIPGWSPSFGVATRTSSLS